MPNSKVSLYIPAYNAEHMLEEVLDAVGKLKFKPDEVLVIDDGSSDRTAEVAQEFDVKVIRKSENRGLAAARNTALKNANGELIACIDSDVRVDENWLSELVNFMERNPDITAVGGRLDERYSDDLPDAWRTKHMKQHWGDVPRQDIPFIFGANGLYRRQALLDIGGFNPLFHTNGEDSNICRRLKEAGHEIAYWPDAKCWHLKRDSISSLLKAYWKWMRHPICIEWPIETLGSLFRFSLRRFIHHLSRNILPDLKKLQLRLLVVDLLVLFYSPYMEAREFVRIKKSKVKMPQEESL